MAEAAVVKRAVEPQIARALACSDLLLFGSSVAKERNALLEAGVARRRVDVLYPLTMDGLVESTQSYLNGSGRVRMFEEAFAKAVEAEENALWDSVGSEGHRAGHEAFAAVYKGDRCTRLWAQVPPRANVVAGRTQLTESELAIEDGVQPSSQQAVMQRAAEADFNHLFLAVWLLLNVNQEHRQAAAEHLLNLADRLLPDLEAVL